MCEPQRRNKRVLKSNLQEGGWEGEKIERKTVRHKLFIMFIENTVQLIKSQPNQDIKSNQINKIIKSNQLNKINPAQTELNLNI